MPSQQVWGHDHHGKRVFWTGREWIHPQWSRDAAGNAVFWSPRDQKWLYPEAEHSNAHAGSGNAPSNSRGNVSATSNVATGFPGTQSGGKPISADSLVQGLASLGVGPSSSPSGDPSIVSRKDETSGVTEYTVTSFTRGVQSKFRKGPPQWITSPSALQYGLTSSKLFQGTGNTNPEAYEELDPSFIVRKEPRKFFRIGRVLTMLHAEPRGGAQSAITAVTRDKRFGEDFYIKTRRFIVVVEGQGSCTAIAISTYGSQGVAKRGVQKSDHAIVYSGRAPPADIPRADEMPSRQEQGKGMRPQRIRVDMADRTDALDPMSRLNFGKVYTIEHNVKVRDVGMVNTNSMSDLFSVFWLVQMEHAQRQGPQGMRLYQSARKALTRPRNDSVAGTSSRRNEQEEDNEESEDDSTDDDEE